MFYYVYFLESVHHRNRHYIGFTTSLEKRLNRHNQKLVSSTKRYAPWKIIYAEAYTNEQDARGRERFLKSGSGWRYLQKQNKHYFIQQ